MEPLSILQINNMKLLIPIILILASIGLFYFVTDPEYTQIKQTSADYDRYNLILQKSNELLGERDKLNEKEHSVDRKDIALLQKMLPDTIDNVRLVLDLNSMAARDGVSLKNIKVNSASSGSSATTLGPSSSLYGSIGLQFSFSAPYPVFLNFLADIERSLRIVDITSLNVKATQPNSFDFDLGLKTYSLK